MAGIQVYPSMEAALRDGFHYFGHGVNGDILVRKTLDTIPKSFGMAIVSPKGAK